MKEQPGQREAHIELWNAVLGADCHIGGCKYRRGDYTYDLSAADPAKWDMIRDGAWCIVNDS